MSGWEPREPNGKGNGWRVGPAWLGCNPDSPQARRDAHLIAAAPDMLEALKDAYCYAASPPVSLPPIILDAMSAAIKKARGEK